MNCAWYERQLANEGAELWRNGRPSATLLEHARGCANCDRLVEHELKLKLMFTELAEKMHAAEPSAAVKHNLLAELQTMRPQKVTRLGWLPRFAIAAMGIACLVLAMLVVVQRVKGHRVVARMPTEPAPAVKTPVVEEARSIKPPVTTSAKNVSRKATRKSTQSQPPVETANDFYPTVMCDSITCAGPAVTVRVELPRSPLSARRSSGGPVMADLLVGEDGLVRGVRLLQ